ncbi:MAG: acriflavin resistance protein [Candidatus Hydrogenedentota bacterium]
MAKQRSLGPRILGWLIVLGLLAAAPAYLLLRESTLEVTAERLERGRVEQTITAIASGTVMPAYDSLVAAASMGTVMVVHKKDGDLVQKGEPLVELRHTELDAQVRLAEANLQAGRSRLEQAKIAATISREVAETNVARAQAQFDQSKKDFERIRALADQKSISQDAFDKAALAMRVAQETLAAAIASQRENEVRAEEVKMAESNIKQLEAALAVATATRDNAIVTAPFSGVIAKIHRDLGEAVTVGMPLLQLVDQTECYVEAPFDEANAAQIRTGQKVRINLDAYRGTDFYGTVDYISPVVSINPDLSRTLNVRVHVDEGTEKFIAGMSADVIIIVEEKDDTLYAPTESLIRQEFAYVVENGRARRREVKTGIGNWNTTEVLEGLREGELLITSVSLSDLADGARVRVVDKLES